MRIVVPFTDLAPQTVERLRDYGPEYVRTPGDDPYAYWRLMDAIFQARYPDDDVLIVEGDKVPTDDQIEEMERCSHLICGHGGLATTRFRRELWTNPQLARHWMRHRKPLHWYGMDGAIYSIWQWIGVKHHRHPGMIEHHHIGASSHERGMGQREQRQLGHR